VERDVTFTDPILGGESVLVRQAIRSKDFVPGVSGWSINRDGTAEFNDVTVRGELYVRDPDGSYVRIYDEDPGDGAIIEFGLPSSVGVTKTPGRIVSSAQIPFADNQPGLVLTSPTVDGTPTAVVSLIADTTNDISEFMVGATDIRLGAEDSVNVNAPGGIALTASQGSVDITSGPNFGDFIRLQGDTRCDDLSDFNGFSYPRIQRGTVNISFAAAQAHTPAFVFPVAFPPGVVPNVHININSSVGSARYWTCRAFNISNTGFTFWFSVTDPSIAAVAWSNVPVQWTAIID
jgi:hypothetical protein